MKKISARTLLASWCLIWSLCMVAVLWQSGIGDKVKGISVSGKQLHAPSVESRYSGAAGGR